MEFPVIQVGTDQISGEPVYLELDNVNVLITGRPRCGKTRLAQLIAEDPRAGRGSEDRGGPLQPMAAAIPTNEEPDGPWTRPNRDRTGTGNSIQNNERGMAQSHGGPAVQHTHAIHTGHRPTPSAERNARDRTGNDTGHAGSQADGIPVRDDPEPAGGPAKPQQGGT